MPQAFSAVLFVYTLASYTAADKKTESHENRQTHIRTYIDKCRLSGNRERVVLSDQGNCITAYGSCTVIYEKSRYAYIAGAEFYNRFHG